MQKILVFLNAYAGQSQRLDWENTIRTALFRSDLAFVTLDQATSWQEAIASALAEPADVVVSVGGDGTFHALIQALHNTPSRFLVLPGGTANDLARELGHGRSVRRALECVRRDEWKAIDLIGINDRLMATNGGLGLVSDVALSINRYRQHIPGFGHLMSTLRHQVYSAVLGIHLLAMRRKTFTVKVDSPVFSGVVETPLLLINNQPMIAGSNTIAPDTRNDDGLFNVTIFLHRDWLDLLMAIYRVRRDVPPENDPHIISFETHAARIELLGQKSDDLVFMGDGESIVRSRVFDLQVQPKSLRVYAQTWPSLDTGLGPERGPPP